MDNSQAPAYSRVAFDKEGVLTTDFPECNGISKLEAFTMAAMQGYIQVFPNMPPNRRAEMAIADAQATLAELSKHQ